MITSDSLPFTAPHQGRVSAYAKPSIANCNQLEYRLVSTLHPQSQWKILTAMAEAGAPLIVGLVKILRVNLTTFRLLCSLSNGYLLVPSVINWGLLQASHTKYFSRCPVTKK